MLLFSESKKYIMSPQKDRTIVFPERSKSASSSFGWLEKYHYIVVAK